MCMDTNVFKNHALFYEVLRNTPLICLYSVGVDEYFVRTRHRYTDVFVFGRTSFLSEDLSLLLLRDLMRHGEVVGGAELPMNEYFCPVLTCESYALNNGILVYGVNTRDQIGFALFILHPGARALLPLELFI